MAAVRPGLGRIIPGSSILFLCDMQEKFRHVSFFPQIVSVAARMLKVAQLLDVPVVLTEQYPQGLGPTVPELGAEGLQPWSKTCFSMVPAVQQVLDARPQLRSVLLCGLETQACILPLPLSAPSTQPWTSWTEGCRSTWWWTPAPPAARWTGWWRCPGCARAAPSSPPAKGSFCSSWVMPPTPGSRRSRRSSRSPPQTAGCLASSMARTPSSAELPTLP
ncbi:isochorismatase domain-containing protein 2 isoform X1 [Phocoena sinus]|uniref:isochorismatase domain-containing protein 2 isoform X1 n=2 Tax=Phocoena sinus TaxID=42100 RepID=UPI0013C4FEE1|nr:isochorismatase domain-containing protein 2 isoform X1 [Phocoena sinus]XP_032468825.1 isochorismatase domain-containing protein 2 isoform X1 [Phocoena sinus]